MSDAKEKQKNSDRSISEHSAAHFITQDDSLASLLLNHGIKVRDFVLLSFLADQGPMTVNQLARVIGIEPERILESLKRLSAAGLLLREPNTTDSKSAELAKLTGRGQNIVRRVNEQL
jgi:DNA-binding MarR family transcriptional regulator